MSFRSKIRKVILIRRFAKNWVRIVFKILNDTETSIFLRNGERLSNVKDPYSLINLLSHGWKIEEHSETFIVLKNRDNVKLKCRLGEGFDLGHIVEIFERDTYSQDYKNFTVIDIGASTADSSIYFAIKGAKEIYSVEPMKESFDLALYNVQLNNLESKVHLINAAMSSKLGTVDLIVSSKNPNANSISPTETVKRSGISFDSKREIDSISLKDIISQYNILKIDLLKMDCEGCEYETLQSIDEKTISLIDNIILEFHDGIKFLPDLLERKGFNVKYEPSSGLGILRASRNTIKLDQSLFNVSNNAV